MRKLFTLFLGILLVNVVFAQRPEGVIIKTTEAPTIDGVVDEIWANANVYNIDRNYGTELPTLGEPGETTWKALWNDDGIFVILQVTDDGFYPNYMVTPAGNNWEYDKPEIYFDCNFILDDGIGGGGGQGHYQWAPGFTADKLDGELQTDANTGIKHAFKVEDPNYVAEYFFPWDYLKDKDGVGFDKTGVMGFDVTIIDREAGDAARKRAVWANMGAINESYSNMNDAGWITFDGAESITYIDTIALTGGVITEDNGTFQVVATILPEDASIKKLKWTVAAKAGSTGRASVSSTGLVTGIMDGVVVVTGAAQDGSYEENTCEVTISGQKITVDEINVIKNGNFDLFDATTLAPTSWGNWVDAAVPTTGESYGTAPVVEDGVVALNSTGSHSADQWHYQFNQSNLTAQPDIPYIFKFKAWAANDRKIAVDFEDIEGNGYTRYGKSTHAFAVNGESEWQFDVTTEPTWFTFDVIFDRIKSNTVQKVQWMISQAIGTVYLDSVSLVSEADMALVPVLQNRAQTFNIYPNPVDTKLNVSLSTAGERVAIFNSLGVKLEEVVVPGTHHVFDVSRYSRGLYFVKSKDTVVKFVK